MIYVGFDAVNAKGTEEIPAGGPLGSLDQFVGNHLGPKHFAGTSSRETTSWTTNSQDHVMEDIPASNTSYRTHFQGTTR
jgi:hypothetical protein